MAEIWFRVYTDITWDRKLRRHSPAIRWAWLAIMAMAKKSPVPGYLLLSGNVSVTFQDVSDEAAITQEEAKNALEIFKEQEMLEEREGVLHLTNWEKRQFISDCSSDRVKKYREKKRFSNVSETPPETETETYINISQNEKEMLNYLKTISGYPFDYQTDLQQIREWVIDFPSKDILHELKQWAVWLRDNQSKLKKKINYRTRFTNWLKPKKWQKEQSKTVNLDEWGYGT